MRPDLEYGTALLATFFGASLLLATAGDPAVRRATPDALRVRELRVLARVLENRLGDVRRSMADVPATEAPATLAREGCRT